jgi:hypothetical protein
MNCPKCGVEGPEPGENEHIHVDAQYRICLFCGCKWSVWQLLENQGLRDRLKAAEDLLKRYYEREPGIAIPTEKYFDKWKGAPCDESERG